MFGRTLILLSVHLLGGSIASQVAWAQCEVQELRGLETTSPLGGFGYSVALSGDSAFVGWWHDDNGTGGTGSVYAFERQGSTWRRVRRFFPASGPGHFATVSVDGDVAAASAWRKSALAGQVAFYERGVAGWTPVTSIVPQDLEWDDEYGFSNSIWGDWAVVGSPKDDGACPGQAQCNSGSVYVYRRTGAGWVQHQKLEASDAAASQYFGTAVAMEGERLVVGAYAPFPEVGGVYVFERTGNTWTETAKMTAPPEAVGADYGLRIALSDSRFAVGAKEQEGGRGVVYVYEHAGGSTWLASEVRAPDGSELDRFGSGLALDGSRLLVGAYGDDDLGGGSGSAYLFERRSGGWTFTGKLHALAGQAQDWFGWSVDLEGDTALVGAPIFLWLDGSRHGSVHSFSIAGRTTPFCEGTGCPCGDGEVTGCLHSQGQGVLLAACGSTRVMEDDLVLRTTGLPGRTTAVLFMGLETRDNLFGDGRFCVGSASGEAVAFPVQASGADGVLSSGPGLVAASAGFGPGAAITAGSRWHFQLGYRDPQSTCGGWSNSSNALTVEFVP